MTYFDLDDNKHHEDSGRQAAKEVESVMKITDLINNHIIILLKCEEQKLMNLSTGQKADLYT